jgi:hypothetical protein
MAFAGIRGTAVAHTGTEYTERPQNFREMILFANPNGRAPLTALLAKAKTESVDDPTFHWWEETLQLVRVSSTTGGVTASTTFTLDSGGLDLVKGDVLQVEKADTTVYNNELIVVSSVSNDTTIVVVRGQFGTAAASTGANVFFTKIGNHFEEGSVSPDISLRNPTRLENHCQIFKTAVGLTKTMNATKMRTGDAWKNDKKRKAFDHSVALELAFLFGVPSENAGVSHPIRTTGGLRYWITTNRTVFTSTPTENTILDALYKVFDVDAGGAGDERIIFAGNGALNTFNKAVNASASSRVNYDGIIDVFGMKLQRWVTPQGTFGIRSHPLMNTHGRYTNSMFVINPMGLIYRPLRDTHFEDNIQANDADLRKGQWLSEVGLEVHHEETFAYLGNITFP